MAAINIRTLYKAVSTAKGYKRFRPSYPKEVATEIMKFMGHINKVTDYRGYLFSVDGASISERHDECKTHNIQGAIEKQRLAVDVGCGPGQSTTILAEYFHQVVGLEISESQLQEANVNNHYPNVKYRAGSADSLPVDDGAVDLITAAQAAHWFDLQRFYQEVDRVLRPNGCLAVYGYGLPQIMKEDGRSNQQFKTLLYNLHYRTWKKYFCVDKRLILANHYQDIILPYKEDFLRVDNLSIRMEYTVEDFIGYLKTTSSYTKCLRDNPTGTDTILSSLQEEIIRILKVNTRPADTPLLVTFPVFLLLSRKPK
ncbi:putative methyltransferase DDB_G0268948 [Glandiceps talaboti]